MSTINKKKITDLPKASTLEGFVTLGVDKSGNSVQVDIEQLKGNKGDKGDAGEVSLEQFTPLQNTVSELEEAVFKQDDWKQVLGITWENGYYVDLNGVITGGGTNTLYKLSQPIPVLALDSFRSLLQAGNLLAISGWNNGVFAPSLAVVGTDTNNATKYQFSIPSTGVTHIRLTCRKELTNPTLEKHEPSSGIGKINRIDQLEEDVDLLKNESTSNGLIASTQNFTGSTTLTGTGTILGGGTLNYPINIATEDLDFVARVTVNTAGVFGLCRPDTTFGTVLTVHDNIAEIRKMNNGVGSIIYSYTLPFTIEIGKEYIVRMYKQNKDIYFAIHSSNDVFVGYAEWLDSKDFGRNWGYPSVFCQSGQIQVSNVFLRKANYKSPLAFFVGHSFIEGWGVVYNLNKRYAALMQQVTGGQVEISGRGGETTATLIARFDKELAHSNSQYVVIDIGANDNTLSTYTTNLNTLRAKVKALGKTPILVSVSPRSGFPIAEMNAYIRSSGELYIDLNKAINNGAENSWNPLYVNSDNVHPNILGNEVMFKRILFDLHFLFDTRKIYEQYQTT